MSGAKGVDFSLLNQTAIVEVGKGASYLACTASSYDAVISDCALNNHDGVVKTTLYFCNELLGSSP